MTLAMEDLAPAEGDLPGAGVWLALWARQPARLESNAAAAPCCGMGEQVTQVPLAARSCPRGSLYAGESLRRSVRPRLVLCALNQDGLPDSQVSSGQASTPMQPAIAFKPGRLHRNLL